MNEQRLYTLKQARALAGMTLKEAGEAVGVSTHMMWMYENGHSTPSLQRGLAIAAAYGMSVYDIEFPQEITSIRKKKGD